MEFASIRDHVLKGLPADTAKDIWNAQPTDQEELHAKILERQRFESLMGKRQFATDEQSVNLLVNQLKGLGFEVHKAHNKQEVNTAMHKKKRKGNPFKGNASKQKSPQSSAWFQSHPRPQRYRGQSNNYRQRNYNNNYNNSWRGGQGNELPNNSRGYGQRPPSGSFMRQQPPRYNNNSRNQFSQNRYGNNNYVNMYDNYDNIGFSEAPYVPHGQACPDQRGFPALPQNHQNVNTLSGNSFI